MPLLGISCGAKTIALTKLHLIGPCQVQHIVLSEQLQTYTCRRDDAVCVVLHNKGISRRYDHSRADAAPTITAEHQHNMRYAVVCDPPEHA